MTTISAKLFPLAGIAVPGESVAVFSDDVRIVSGEVQFFLLPINVTLDMLIAADHPILASLTAAKRIVLVWRGELDRHIDSSSWMLTECIIDTIRFGNIRPFVAVIIRCVQIPAESPDGDGRDPNFDEINGP